MTPVASLPAAGRELDEQIAATVMSWKQCEIPEHGPDCSYWWETDGLRHGHTLPDFSTDIAAAWEVVEKLRGDWRFLFQETPGRAWPAVFASHSQHEVAFMADAETAPEAICLSALKTVAALKAVAP